MRIGIGYDIHRLVENRKLILGGVEIEHHLGLLGHSDADALAHAIADALLGAAALGDIGLHFPDTDPEYKGISSMLILNHIATLLKDCGWKVVNIDTVIIAEKPKLLPHVSQMQENLTAALGLPLDMVSIKATTNEGLDALGSQQGIACQAIAMIEEIS